MKAARTHQSRQIDYSNPSLKFDGRKSLKRAVIGYIGGFRGQRKNPVTKNDILGWFQATDSHFVDAVLTELVTEGAVRVSQRSLASGRRSNGVYVYEVVERSCAA